MLHADELIRVLSRGKLKRRWVELTMLTLRLGGLLNVVFLVLPPGQGRRVHGRPAGGLRPLHGRLLRPNHVGMPLVPARLRLDFLRRQVLMSRNVSGGRPMAVLMGGLTYQVEHHFPVDGRPHLRHAQPLVEAHCVAVGVPYTQTTLWQSYGIVIRYLNTVGFKGRDPFLCPLVAGRRAL